MSELQKMTAAGGTVQLGGRTYLLKQLTLGDYGQIQAWLKQRLPKPFAVVVAALKELEPMRAFDPEGYAEARKQLLLNAMEDSKKDGGGSPELVSEALNSPEGIAMLIWLCVRKCHPEVGYEEIKAAINSENLSELKRHLDIVNMFGGGDAEEEGDPFANPQTPPAGTT